MTSAITSTSNIVSLAAFKAARAISSTERSMPPVIDIDAWYHQEEVAKAAPSKSSQERQ